MLRLLRPTTRTVLHHTHLRPLHSHTHSPTHSPTPSTRGTRGLLRSRINTALSELHRTHYPLLDLDLSHFDGAVFPTPKPEKFGDYQCNVCMPLAKHLKMKPRDIATQLVTLLRVEDMVAETTVAGPGFLNFRVSETYVKSELSEIICDPSKRLGIKRTEFPKRTVIDYSSPNIAKEMHVGHLRSTIIGHSLSKVLEFLGHEVLRVNHIGDWGTQFGMLIEYLNKEHPELCHDTDGNFETTIGDLVTFYKSARLKFDSDEEFKNSARERVVQLQQNALISCSEQHNEDSTILMWKKICEISRKEFCQTYEMLGIENLIEKGESTYNAMLPDVVKLCLDIKVASLSEGAVCIFPTDVDEATEGAPPPLMIQKSDGGYLYPTTDLAALIHRVWVERADRILYVTDLSQAEHFRKVFEAARRSGFVGTNAEYGSNAAGVDLEQRIRSICDSVGDEDHVNLSTPQEVELRHVGFGLVMGEDDKKLKSREGEALRLRDLLDEALLRSGLELEKRQLQYSATGDQNSKDRLLTDQEVSDAARVIGIGAVKYADLSMNREGNYKFSFDKMLSMNGNTAPYLLYAYVRIRGIQRQGLASITLRGGDNSFHSSPTASEVKIMLDLRSPSEFQLAKHLIRFQDVLLEVERTLLPNKLCDYLYDLSNRFNTFYETCSVLHADTTEQQQCRIYLCNATADTLKLGLNLLGIDTVDKL